MNIDYWLEKASLKQNQMHSVIDDIIKEGKRRGKNISYDAAKTIFFLMEISRLESEIENIKYPLQ